MKIFDSFIRLDYLMKKIIMYNTAKIFLVSSILLILLTFQNAYSDLSNDTLIYDGFEVVHSFGMDTTDHWWVITTPYTGQYRVIIDGIESDSYYEIKHLSFSPDGKRWAYFALNAVQWYLVTNDTIISLPGNGAGELLFSDDSKRLIYSYMFNEEEHIIVGKRKYIVINRSGKLITNYNGTRLAFMMRRAGSYVLNINGTETTVYDEIIPVGFWNDGRFIYAGRNSVNWRIYKGDEEITEVYSSVTETAINRFGTVFAALVTLMSGHTVCIMLSDEYISLIESKKYESGKNLVLHPELSMYSFSATLNNNNYIVYSGAEYYAGKEASEPFFSYDGSELIYIGCDVSCSIFINGKKYPVTSDFATDRKIAIKPGGETVAYTTSSNLVLRYLDRNYYVAGMMVDLTGDVRYNWREARYEALGMINGRVYLLTIAT